MLVLWHEYPVILGFLFIALAIWFTYIGELIVDVVRWNKVYKDTMSKPAKNSLTAAWFTLAVYIVAGAFVIWCVFWPHPY